MGASNRGVRNPHFPVGLVVTAAIVLAVYILLAGTAPARAAVALTPAETPPEVVKVTGDLALGDRIVVTVKDVGRYVNTTIRDPSKFALYIDGRRIDGVTPVLVPAKRNSTYQLTFDIQRTEQSKAAWDALLGSPPLSFTRPVSVSVGYENGDPVQTSETKYRLSIIHLSFWGWLVTALVVAALVLFGYLVASTSIIREPSDRSPRLRPFSLGRSQMAFWFFIVLGSFAFIWMITGVVPPLSESALALIGISALTALGATLVDSGKETKDANLRHAMRSRVTKGFADDVLADTDGYNFHRFQMAIWTLVLGVIFASAVYKTLAMPEFEGTLLALMGISGGTYVGFKFQENQTKTTKTTAKE